MCECHQYASHNPAPTASSTSEVTAACYLTALDQLLPLVAKLRELLSLFLSGVLDPALSTGDSAQPHTTECCHFDAFSTVTLPPQSTRVYYSAAVVSLWRKVNALDLFEFILISFWVCLCLTVDAVRSVGRCEDAECVAEVTVLF